MIRYTEGNLLEADAEALVNTVNEVGVMGKGIALMFRESFPENARAYERAAKSGDVRVGKMFVTQHHSLVGPKWIINFPTKKHWRQPSKLQWIRDGLRDMINVLRDNGIASVAVPPLGSGSGGLDWELVRREIEAASSELPGVVFMVFGPSAKYQNEPKRAGVELLTPARALIAELARRYAVLGLECTNLEIQKLAWFLSRTIIAMGLTDPFKLRFAADKYGPYSDRLRHLLNGLDGSYLHCERRLADAGPMDLIWFEDSHRGQLRSYLEGNPMARYLAALDLTTRAIDGFESPLGMELLATIDWLVFIEGNEATLAGVRHGIENWPAGAGSAKRKRKLFDDRVLALGLARVREYNDALAQVSQKPRGQ